MRAAVIARVASDGLPARHHVSPTVAPATIRRPRPQSGAASATRTGFADDDSSVCGEASLAIVMLVGIVHGPDIAPGQRYWDVGFGISGIVIGGASCFGWVHWANQCERKAVMSAFSKQRADPSTRESRAKPTGCNGRSWYALCGRTQFEGRYCSNECGCGSARRPDDTFSPGMKRPRWKERSQRKGRPGGRPANRTLQLCRKADISALLRHDTANRGPGEADPIY